MLSSREAYATYKKESPAARSYVHTLTIYNAKKRNSIRHELTAASCILM